MEKTVKCCQEIMEQCKYRGALNGEGYSFCDYLGIVGKRRGCPSSECNKFEKIGDKKKKWSIKKHKN